MNVFLKKVSETVSGHTGRTGLGGQPRILLHKGTVQLLSNWRSAHPTKFATCFILFSLVTKPEPGRLARKQGQGTTHLPAAWETCPSHTTGLLRRAIWGVL